MNAAPGFARHCPICSDEPVSVGTRVGRLDARQYLYLHCPTCRLSFVADPRSDFESIYTEEYYKGLGADPMVDYEYELTNPEKTIRNYEWRGLLSVYRQLSPQPGRWLDFGCGCGGLVAFAGQHGIDIVGFDEGWGAQAGRSAGIRILTREELLADTEKFDFISAVEVIEHVSDPVALLATIRSLLKPGGVLFLTTGNARPWRGNLFKWGYLSAPEVHISFFEPETLELAYRKAGLEPKRGFFLDGYVDIIKYKVLKILRVRNQHRLIDWLPWKLMSRVVDWRHQVTRQPYAIRPSSGE